MLISRKNKSAHSELDQASFGIYSETLSLQMLMFVPGIFQVLIEMRSDVRIDCPIEDKEAA